jgi:hypothetical protein
MARQKNSPLLWRTDFLVKVALSLTVTLIIVVTERF